MGQFSKVLLAIDNAHTVPQRALNCGPGIGGLTRFMGPTVPLPLFRVPVASISTSLPDVPIVQCVCVCVCMCVCVCVCVWRGDIWLDSNDYFT